MTLHIIIAYIICNLIISKTTSFNPKSQKLWFLSIYLFLGMIAGLRSIYVGVDTISYYYDYVNLSNVSLSYAASVSRIEVGYIAFQKLIQYLGGDYYCFQFVYSILMFSLIGKFVSDNTKDVYLATIIFLGSGFFAFTLNIVRQMMGIAIAANSWTYIKERKYKIAILIILLGFLFHKTILLYFLPLLLYKYKDKAMVIYGFTLIVALITFMLPSIFNILKEYNLYNTYTDLDHAGVKAGGIYVVWIAEFIIIAIILFNCKFSRADKIVANLSLFFVVMSILDERVKYLDRVGLLFYPFILILFCCFGDKIQDKYVKSAYFIGCSAFFLLFFIYRRSELANFSYCIQ